MTRKIKTKTLIPSQIPIKSKTVSSVSINFVALARHFKTLLIRPFKTNCLKNFSVGELGNAREASKKLNNLIERIFPFGFSVGAIEVPAPSYEVEVSGLSPFVSLAIDKLDTSSSVRRPDYPDQVPSLFKVASLSHNLRNNFQTVFMTARIYKRLFNAFRSALAFTKAKMPQPVEEAAALLLTTFLNKVTKILLTGGKYSKFSFINQFKFQPKLWINYG